MSQDKIDANYSRYLRAYIGVEPWKIGYDPHCHEEMAAIAMGRADLTNSLPPIPRSEFFMKLAAMIEDPTPSS